MKIYFSKSCRFLVLALLLLSLSSCRNGIFSFFGIYNEPDEPSARNESVTESDTAAKAVSTGYDAGGVSDLSFSMTEDKEGIITAEVKNTGGRVLSQTKIRLIIYGIRESGVGEGLLKDEVIREVMDIGPNSIHKFRYDARQFMDRLIKIKGSVECIECDKIAHEKRGRTFYPSWAGVKPELSLGLAEDNEGTVMVQLRNKGKMTVTDVRLKVTACCNLQTGNQEELFNDVIKGSIDPSQMFIKVYNLKDLIANRSMSEIVRVAYSVSCEECVGIEKEKRFSAPVEMMFIRGGDLPSSTLPHEVDETKKAR